MLRKIKKKYSKNSRKKRGELFVRTLSLQKTDCLLDLGGGNGSYIYEILANEEIGNVTISDISESDLSYAEQKFGYKTSLLDEGKKLPFSDNEFDIIFCNSVIEHVTLPKKDIWSFKSTKAFKELSLKRQGEFANEIRRIGKSYFVQTPYKYFIIESHSWLPGIIAILPRNIQISLIRFFNKFWMKKTSPDWNLLTFKDMQQLFPEAQIYREKSLGLTKSLVAIKAKASSNIR
ncbi:MAG: methyltransferase domain-containing protein [Bacteroidetes bacterium]|nr:methyltransferase domain-containing protein [Bacteroidota bacterium]